MNTHRMNTHQKHKTRAALRKNGVKKQSLRTEINQGQGLTLTYPKLTHLSQQNKENKVCPNK